MTELPISASLIDWSHLDDEGDLIERAKRDPQAFAALYRQHYAAMAAYVYRRLGNAHATEDVVADVFFTAMRSLPRYRYRGVPIRAWLYRIAATATNRWVRRQRRRAMLGLGDGLDRPCEQDVSPDDDMDARQARAAMLRLAPNFQTALSLHYLVGMSIEEIATVTGWRIGTVKSRLSRGRAALRRKLSNGSDDHARKP